MKNNNFETRIGFMQGRLSDLINNKIQSFPIYTWQKEFKWANQLNIRKMEWTIDYENIMLNPLMTELGRERINILKTKYKIEIPSITCDCFMQNPFWKNFNNGENKKLLDLFFKLIEACQKIDCKILVIPLVDNGSLETKIQEKYLITFLKDNIEFLKNHNVKIAFEIDFEPSKVSLFINQLDEEIFGINYDIGNSASLGYLPNEEILAYGNRIINIHIKDRILGGSTVPLGEGDADIPLVLSLVHEINYNGNFIFQTARSSKGKHRNLIKKYYTEILETLNDF